MDGLCDPASTPSATRRDSLSGFSDFASVQFNSPFPIELVDFTAERRKNTVECNWITASEINNNYFIVERSRDTKNVEDVGRIDGAGNSTSNKYYAFKDESPMDGLSYYRLKQIDYDGRMSFSHWVPVSFLKKMNQLLLYPNPAKTGLSCDFLTAENGEATIGIYDLAGKIIFSEKKIIVAGQNKIELNISSLADGFYFVGMSENNSDLRQLESKARFMKVSN